MLEVGQLDVDGNHSLTSLVGMSSLPALGELSISGAGLTTLTGLEGIAVTGGVQLRENDELVALTGLDAVTQLAESLYVGMNPKLTSLSAIDGIAQIDGDLRVVVNGALPQLDAELWGAARTVGGLVKIDGNLGAAPHVDECPWVNDYECDEPGGTGLCPAGYDEDDCAIIPP